MKWNISLCFKLLKYSTKDFIENLNIKKLRYNWSQIIIFQCDLSHKLSNFVKSTMDSEILIRTLDEMWKGREEIAELNHSISSNWLQSNS